MNSIETGNVRTDMVQSLDHSTTIDVLRLDLIHPVISGNKWFKLKEYLKEAVSSGQTIIATFGGAFSNHIVATAAAAKEYGLKSIGIIRGEAPPLLSHSLKEATYYGMELIFTSREDYKEKNLPLSIQEQVKKDEIYLISEGGYGLKGASGAMDILKLAESNNYTHIIAGVGTGTMLAGLRAAADKMQSVIGISVMKNNFSLEKAIENILPEEMKSAFTLIHDYHFGGYAKYNQELIDFMNEWFRENAIPSDFVYTGKVFYAVNNLIAQKYFPPGAKILVIHSGGLQGNRSLPNGKLIF